MTPRAIRSYVLRQGRTTPAQQRALEELLPKYGIPFSDRALDLKALFGRSAPVVGEKLWGLTSEHQVLCVTHMPQVAAYADAHLVVAKGADDGSSRVAVRSLEPSERVEELAQMLGGPLGGQGARRNARELLDGARARKRDASRR